MKRKLIFLFLSAMSLSAAFTSCKDELGGGYSLEEASALATDNESVTLVQGDEITVNIISGNGNYSVKPFDESIVQAKVEGTVVTIKALEDSGLNEDNIVETTVLVIDGRKKVARIEVRIAKLWELTTDVLQEDGLDLFIGETRTVKILTGNGDYKVTVSDGGTLLENDNEFIRVGEISGQVFTVTGLKESDGHDLFLNIEDKKGKKTGFPVKVNIVDLTLESDAAEFDTPDAQPQYIGIEKGNGGYSFTYKSGDADPVTEPTIVEATESNNIITLKPKSRGEVTVIVRDQKGSEEKIAVKVNPYNIELEGNPGTVTLDGFKAEKSIAISKGNGSYQLAELTEEADRILESAEIAGNELKIKAKWFGSTTLQISDAAGMSKEISVEVAPVAALLESDRCFRIDIKKYIEQHPDFDEQTQLTFEMVFYPTYSRSLQSFIGLEGVFLLRCENNGDTDLRFEIATKIHKNPDTMEGDTFNDPRFRSQQRMGNDRQNNGQWYHVAIVFDGSQSSTKEAYRMYINGVREELTAAEGDYADVRPDKYLKLSQVGGDNALMIGRSGNNEFRLGYCAVAQARMWTVARTESQIKDDMCIYWTPDEALQQTGLAGYWIPSEGIGDIDVFPNYGTAGNGLDAVVYDNAKSDISPTPFPDRYKNVECPHSY